MVFKRQNSLNAVGNCWCVMKTRPGDRKCAVTVGNNSWWPKMVENACWLSEMGTGTGKSQKWQSGGMEKVITVKICQKWMLVVENEWKQSQTTDCCSKMVTGCQNLFENDLLLLFPVSLSLCLFWCSVCLESLYQLCAGSVSLGISQKGRQLQWDSKTGIAGGVKRDWRLKL